MQKLAGIASEIMQQSGSPALSQESSSGPPSGSSSGPSDELLTRLLPMISAISQSGQTPCNPSKRQLLDALRPFLSSATCAQIDHAEHIVSMAQMAKAAQAMLMQSGQQEV